VKHLFNVTLVSTFDNIFASKVNIVDPLQVRTDTDSYLVGVHISGFYFPHHVNTVVISVSNIQGFCLHEKSESSRVLLSYHEHDVLLHVRVKVTSINSVVDFTLLNDFEASHFRNLMFLNAIQESLDFVCVLPLCY